MTRLSFKYTILFFIVFQIFGQEKSEVKAWIGISIEEKEGFVYIKSAIAGTPGEKAGLKSGDKILKIDSTKIQTVNQLIGYIQSRGVGNEVSIEYIRDKKEKKLKLFLEAKPDQTKMLQKQFVGKNIPQLNLTNMADGKKITNNILKDKVVILEFWATWCGPCVASHKTLSKFAEENPNISILAISNEEKTLIEKYIKNKYFKFTTAFDDESKLHNFFSVSAIPMSVVVDKKGIIQSIALGGGYYLEENLKKAIELNK